MSCTQIHDNDDIIQPLSVWSSCYAVPIHPAKRCDLTHCNRCSTLVCSRGIQIFLHSRSPWIQLSIMFQCRLVQMSLSLSTECLSMAKLGTKGFLISLVFISTCSPLIMTSFVKISSFIRRHNVDRSTHLSRTHGRTTRKHNAFVTCWWRRYRLY